MELYLAFAITTATFALIPGPAMLYAAARTLAGGRRAGLMASLGLHLGLPSGASQPAQWNTPGRFSALRQLVPARSVPCSRSTRYWSGVRISRHSASLRVWISSAVAEDMEEEDVGEEDVGGEDIGPVLLRGGDDAA